MLLPDVSEGIMSEQLKFHHTFKVDIYSAHDGEGGVCYQVSVNGEGVCCAYPTRPEDLSLEKLEGEMRGFEMAIRSAARKAGDVAFRKASTPGRFVAVIYEKYIDESDPGRPREWTREDIEQKVRIAVSSFKRKHYNKNPTLDEAASEIKMPVATLKKLLQRYRLKYSAYKKET